MIIYPWFMLALFHFVFSQTTDKYSDEDRPYKFGFNIQGYQHRQEEKDEKGLIKGEYGFITADGYYRVTVYATDENGDFRIISMKNYYVGFPPEDPTTTPGPSGGSARAPLPGPTFGARPGPTGKALERENDKPQIQQKPFVRPQGLAACSDCSIPTTTVRTNQGFGGNDFRNGRTDGGFGAPGFGRSFGGNHSPQFPQGSPQSAFQSPGGGQNPQGVLGRGGPGLSGGQPLRGSLGGDPQGPAGKSFSQFSPETPRSNIQQTSGGFGSVGPTGPGSSFGGGNQQGGSFGSSDPNFPKGRNDFTQNNQLGDSPRQRPQIGEVREGLPPGVTLNDIKDLLYTFNYTVGFHGHHEDGYRNGDKQGDYFFDGRDGVERKVEYLANEFGYQPNITLIDLPENDVRRPKEQTEKEYGLKGYEFKWFYRK